MDFMSFPYLPIKTDGSNESYEIVMKQTSYPNLVINKHWPP